MIPNSETTTHRRRGSPEPVATAGRERLEVRLPAPSGPLRRQSHGRRGRESWPSSAQRRRQDDPLKTIVGFVPLFGGRIVFDGRDCTRQRYKTRVRAGMSYTSAEAPVFRDLAVRDNLELGGFTVASGQARATLMRQVFALFPILEERQAQLAGTSAAGSSACSPSDGHHGPAETDVARRTLARALPGHRAVDLPANPPVRPGRRDVGAAGGAERPRRPPYLDAPTSCAPATSSWKRPASAPWPRQWWDLF